MTTVPFLSFKEINKQLRPEIIRAFESVFDEAWYIMGQQLAAFEKEYAMFNRVNHAIGISNGLDALHIALKTLGIGEGDEVIVPSHTYIATVLAITYAGAKPVFVEPDRDTYNIDTNNIEAVITSATKAIMPVHLYGQACDMSKIEEIAEKNKLFVIEDNAQAHGATWNGKLTGSWGHLNATSFYPGKNLGALGDAGAVTTDDASYADKANSLRNYGSVKKYKHDEIGYNQRMDEMQAAFLRVKLKYLAEWTRQRQEVAENYDRLLQGTGDIITPLVAKEATHVYHLYVIRTNKRDLLQQFLQERGIGTLIHYPIPVHLQRAYHYLGYKKGDFPIAELIADTCLSLPVWPGMSQRDIETVANAVKDFFEK